MGSCKNCCYVDAEYYLQGVLLICVTGSHRGILGVVLQRCGISELALPATMKRT